jgi:hypothetical protein
MNESTTIRILLAIAALSLLAFLYLITDENKPLICDGDFCYEYGEIITWNEGV